ncbi:unnamed protein product [Cuscuta campestris]|uniref:Uncharacterized protein n=1 Tax=Cuscuta campestris TaxID=132261 RepID=A0A484KP49_9ASTE|nr:unnamed protein product [Cuscuta campestris]
MTHDFGDCFQEATVECFLQTLRPDIVREVCPENIEMRSLERAIISPLPFILQHKALIFVLHCLKFFFMFWRGMEKSCIIAGHIFLTF